jgi:hypothetical protein
MASVTAVAIRDRGVRVKSAPLAVLIPLATLIVCNIADIVTTHRLLSMGAREMNPVAGWLIHNDGLVVAKLAIVALISVAAVVAPPRRRVITGMWIVTAFYAAIIAFHVAQLTLAS